VASLLGRPDPYVAPSLPAGWPPGVARACVSGGTNPWLDHRRRCTVGTVATVLLIGLAVDVSYATLRVDPAGGRRRATESAS
jgi:hypothetical protein